MLNKKLKKRLGVMVVAVGVLAGSMNAFAASYVTGNIPGHSSKNCTGSLAYYNRYVTAGTSCNYNDSNDADKLTFKTTVRGVLLDGDLALGTTQNDSGTKKAQLYHVDATGCSWANGTHQVTYQQCLWSDITNI